MTSTTHPIERSTHTAASRASIRATAATSHAVRWRSILALLVTACGKGTAASADGGSADAAAVPVATASAAAPAEPPAPPTSEALLEQHRKDMSAAAEDGRFAEVCAGTPWFNQTICNWAAGKASGKSPARPGGDVFHPFFVSQHWAKVYGQIVAEADSNGDYEVSVGGYKHHCILDTDETKFSSKGAFHMWVQEQPETREVTVNSGASQQWVVLEEATLATMLMELAHSSGGVEATASAKNIMGLVATFVPYSEKKGELPTVPGAAAAPSASSSIVPGAAALTRPPSAAAASASPGSTKPPGSVVNSNVARIKQCCSAIRLQAKTGDPSSEKSMLGAAAQCDGLASQASGEPLPDFTPVRQMLRGRIVPVACAGM